MKISIILDGDYDVSMVPMFCERSAGITQKTIDNHFLTGIELVNILNRQKELIKNLEESNKKILHAIYLTHKGERG